MYCVHVFVFAIMAIVYLPLRNMFWFVFAILIVAHFLINHKHAGFCSCCIMLINILKVPYLRSMAMHRIFIVLLHTELIF